MTHGSRTRTSRAARMGLGLCLGWLAGCTHPEKKTITPVRQVGPASAGAGAAGQPFGSTASGTPASRTAPGLPGLMPPSSYPTAQPMGYPAAQPPSSFPAAQPGGQYRGQADVPSRFDPGIGVSPRPLNSAMMTPQPGGGGAAGRDRPSVGELRLDGPVGDRHADGGRGPGDGDGGRPGASDAAEGACRT